MQVWKKAAAVAAIVVVSASAGIAWASSSGLGQRSGGAPTRVLLGGGQTESKFVAVTPCRLVDTRNTIAGAIPSGQTRRFDVKGNESTFQAQGGKVGGCGIPATGVAAVEITVTAVGAAGNGYLRVFPLSEPTATFLNYTKVFNASNTGTVALCSTGCAENNQDLAVKNVGTATHVVIDVQGYYGLPITAMVNADGSLGRGTRVKSVTHAGTGLYTVNFDRDVSACAYQATGTDAGTAYSFGMFSVARKDGLSTAVFVQARDENGSSVDRAFTVEVIC